MAKIGLLVPPSFTITTEVCSEYYKNNGKLPDEVLASAKKLWQTWKNSRAKSLEILKIYHYFPFVRAQESMPGMMDTILNLGLIDETVRGQVENINNSRLAYECYRRFIQMYRDIVMGVHAENNESRDPFEEILSDVKKKAGVHSDPDLTAENFKDVIVRYKKMIVGRTGKEFPQDVFEQLERAIGAVFESW
jgi:pyruvate,orthophosphate dikinase